jgi:hypothetical protein
MSSIFAGRNLLPLSPPGRGEGVFLERIRLPLDVNFNKINTHFKKINKKTLTN